MALLRLGLGREVTHLWPELALDIMTNEAYLNALPPEFDGKVWDLLGSQSARLSHGLRLPECLD
jgi:hypothetical protein